MPNINLCLFPEEEEFFLTILIFFRYKIKTHDVNEMLVLKSTKMSEGQGMSDSRAVCYHCDVCDNMFTSPDNITDHKKTYHESARLNTVNPKW